MHTDLNSLRIFLTVIVSHYMMNYYYTDIHCDEYCTNVSSLLVELRTIVFCPPSELVYGAAGDAHQLQLPRNPAVVRGHPY